MDRDGRARAERERERREVGGLKKREGMLKNADDEKRRRDASHFKLCG